MLLAAVNLPERWALTHDDRVVRIKAMLDDRGNDTEDPAEAVLFMAGEGFEYRAYLVSDIPQRTRH